MAISHIVFDLGNVLVPVDTGEAVRKLAPHLPADIRQAALADPHALERLIEEPRRALEMGRIEFEEFSRQVSAILGVPLHPKDFHEIWCSMFSLDAEMVGLGERLATRYGTWLASNTSLAHYTWIVEHFPRVQFYRDAALSYELGVMKPEHEYFKRALHRFGIDPETSLFIDDIAQNVDAARECGLHGVLFTSREQLMRDLSNHHVEIPETETKT